MKQYIKYFTIGALAVSGLTSCNDFLDREPLSSITPSTFFNTADDLSAYTINYYPFKTVGSGYGVQIFGEDNNSDNQAGSGYSSIYVPGEWRVGSGTDNWSWGNIRSCNYFFQQVLPKYEAGSITGNQANVKHYIGEMYVIRAYNYFNMLKTIGDAPIIDVPLNDVRDELTEASKRRPRHKVAQFIIDDLKKAEALLSENAPGGKNRISRDVASLLRARVALYEATWEKYHAGTAFVPGGSGWPGSDSESFSADLYNTFLTEAMDAAKIVGDKYYNRLAENTQTAEGMDSKLSSLNPYYTMFCDEDMSGYDEVLMWKKFDLSLGIVNELQMELERNGGATGWTRGLVNSFLMKNGLPIYDSQSGYDPEWEKEGVNKTLEGRDSRIVIFTKKPGDVNYYQSNGTPDLCEIDYIFGNAGTEATTGFMVKKGKHYSELMAVNHHYGTSGGICFRAAEALLIYMEASYEKNANIDATASQYWKALRKRAGVDEDFTKTIAATVMAEEAKGDWGAYSKGALIDPTLYNIRRERRNELIGEAMRLDDLKRWRALDQLVNNPYQVEGMLFWGSVYETELASKTMVGENMNSKEQSNYILPYHKVLTNNSVHAQGGLKWNTAHYLSPIGASVFRQTASDATNIAGSSSVYQNPGWSTEAGTSPK